MIKKSEVEMANFLQGESKKAAGFIPTGGDIPFTLRSLTQKSTLILNVDGQVQNYGFIAEVDYHENTIPQRCTVYVAAVDFDGLLRNRKMKLNKKQNYQDTYVLLKNGKILVGANTRIEDWYSSKHILTADSITLTER
jgi:hypothetical protein